MSEMTQVITTATFQTSNRTFGLNRNIIAVAESSRNQKEAIPQNTAGTDKRIQRLATENTTVTIHT